MTGCYANRVGMEGALNHTSRQGIHADELLLPELLRSKGYATAVFGKWHLGLSPHFSPLQNGFDEYFGIPYSNDNSRFHPSLASEMPPLPLYEGKREQGESVIERDPDQSLFTRRITDHAIDFIERHSRQPFFLYVPHVMPHVPIFASASYRGKSPHGLYADVVEELDASVGEILAALDRTGVREKTLILFSSDNGPFLSYGTHAGSAGTLREGKLTAYEGGVRVPCIANWKGKIPAGRICEEPWMTIDLLPTFASWIGASLPERPIDGKNASDLFWGTAGSRSPHQASGSTREVNSMRFGRGDGNCMSPIPISRWMASRAGRKTCSVWSACPQIDHPERSGGDR